MQKYCPYPSIKRWVFSYIYICILLSIEIVLYVNITINPLTPNDFSKYRKKISVDYFIRIYFLVKIKPHQTTFIHDIWFDNYLNFEQTKSLPSHRYIIAKSQFLLQFILTFISFKIFDRKVLKPYAVWAQKIQQAKNYDYRSISLCESRHLTFSLNTNFWHNVYNIMFARMQK